MAFIIRHLGAVNDIFKFDQSARFGTRDLAPPAGYEPPEYRSIAHRLRGSLLAPAHVKHAWGCARISAIRKDVMLLDLLRTRGRQTIDKIDPARHLEVGQFSVAVLEQCVCCDIGVLSFGQHYARKHFLFAEFVWDGNNCDLLHHFVRLQDCLDFGGRNILARATNNVLLAVDETEHPTAIPLYGITCMKPAAAPGMGGCLFVAEITRKEAPSRRRLRMADDHLARLPRRDVVVPLVDYADIDTRCRPAESAGADRTRRLVIEQYAHHLGHSPYLDEGETETPLEQAVKLRLDASAKTEANCMIPLFDAFGHTEQKGHDYPEIVNDCGPCLADFRPPSVRIKPVSLDLAAPAEHSAMERQNG